MAHTIAVLDFGSQYTQVIARRIRECEVYSKIYHFATPVEELEADGVTGVILSGGPNSVFAKNAPKPDPKVFEMGVPVLGICYGLQLMGKMLKGKVARSKEREFGLGTLSIVKPGRLFRHLPRKLKVWNSHRDSMRSAPPIIRL
jgi:GMP synthase (glutamine-hydrolysing)